MFKVDYWTALEPIAKGQIVAANPAREAKICQLGLPRGFLAVGFAICDADVGEQVQTRDFPESGVIPLIKTEPKPTETWRDRPPLI